VAAQLVSQVTELERSSDWPTALKKLDEAKAIQPAQPYLWSNYGYIAMRKGKPDDAKKDFRRELELHPSETYVVIMYAGYLHYRKEDQEASSVLGSSFKSDPSQEGVALLLASLQAKASLADAIATIRRAVTASPSSHNLPVDLASYLIRNHENGEAATILKKQLDGADDPSLLNNAGYLLAESGTDLPVAEQKVRQALDKLNAQSSQASIGEANAQSFQRASLLVATWDTLGYILLQEDKLDEARDYLEPAWKNLTSPAIGEHYGKLLEREGKPSDALRIYQLTASSPPSGDAPPELQDVKDAAERLEKAGTKSKAGDAARTLQDERSFKLPVKSAPGSYVSATFRLQFSAGASPDVLRVSGDSSLDDASDEIRKLRLPSLVPTQSTARMLRDAVVTCSPGKKDCFFVLMPLGGIDAENVSN
jgi:predicted Zn-dependent protease